MFLNGPDLDWVPSDRQVHTLNRFDCLIADNQHLCRGYLELGMTNLKIRENWGPIEQEQMNSLHYLQLAFCFVKNINKKHNILIWVMK